MGYHTKRFHSNKVDSQCVECDYVTKRRNHLTRHVMVYHEMKRYRCDKCERVFKDKRGLKVHILSKHEGVVWQCNICPFKGVHPQSLSEHKKYLHGVNLIKKQKQQFEMKCEHCGFTSENQDILKLHAVSHQISLMDIMTNLPASIKEASFKTEDEFLTDLKGFLQNSSVAKSDDKERTLTVECGECDLKLQPRNLKRHRRLVHEKNVVKKEEQANVECKSCGQRFVCKSSFPRHILQVHNSNEERIECDSCGKKMFKRSLEKHMRKVHIENGKIKCGEAECYTMLNPDSMRKHKRSSHEKKRVECKHCGKKLSLDSLQRHISLVHERILTECKNCGKKLRKESLQRHVRLVHERIGAECKICGKMLCKESLQRHISLVHEKKRIECKVCSKRLCKDSLQKHMRLIHSKNVIKGENSESSFPQIASDD